MDSSKQVKRKASTQSQDTNMHDFIPVWKFEDQCLSLNDTQGNCLAQMGFTENSLFLPEGVVGTLTTVLAVLDAMKEGNQHSLVLASSDAR